MTHILPHSNPKYHREDNYSSDNHSDTSNLYHAANNNGGGYHNSCDHNARVNYDRDNDSAVHNRYAFTTIIVKEFAYSVRSREQ